MVKSRTLNSRVQFFVVVVFVVVSSSSSSNKLKGKASALNHSFLILN